MTPQRVRVVVVDDNATMRRVLSAYLGSDERLEVVAVHDSAESVLAGVAAACPDVIVLDNQMPGGDGVDVLDHLRERCPTARIVLFSATDEAAQLALQRGAAVVVDKRDPLDVLVDAVLRDS